MSYTVGVVVHPTRPVAASVRQIVAWAQREGAVVLGRTGDRAQLGDAVACVADDELAARVDGVVALGGDGTMLGALRLVAGRPAPVLGVNHGHLGFLVEVDPGGLGAALARLAAGDFTLEPHPGLAVGVGPEADPGPTRQTAFNDVCLVRAATTGSISVDLAINGARYGYYRADGVVLATPSGSTAYNYSAGGPVLSPSATAAVLTPVAPIAGIARSVVIGGDDVITLSPGDESDDVEVQYDGVPLGRLRRGEAVQVRLAPQAASVVRFDAEQHARRNRIVLSLRDLPLRPDQLLELVPAQLRDRLPRRHE